MRVGAYCFLIIGGARIYCKVFDAADSSFLMVDCLDIDTFFLMRISQDFYVSKLVAHQKP